MTFDEELNNIDNLKIMSKASKPFIGQLTPEEIRGCQLIALWKAIEDFIPTEGSKFTTILYNRVKWECLRELKINKPIPAFSICGSGIADDTDYFNCFKHVTGDIPEEYYKLLYKRFVEDKTFAEIGKEHGYTGENARIKIKKAMTFVKELIEI